MLRHALKEWAVICRALAEGRQAILLRKGGIAETAGEFRVEHTRFWLYPTILHQQQHDGIKLDARPLLDEVIAQRPAEGVLHLDHFAEVEGIYHVHDIASVLKLSPLHLWSDDTALSRFRYKTPGLYVLAVRVFKVPQAVEVAELPEFAGCKSWVDLQRDLSVHGAVPVLNDDQFRDGVRELERILQPTAFA